MLSLRGVPTLVITRTYLGKEWPWISSGYTLTGTRAGSVSQVCPSLQSAQCFPTISMLSKQKQYFQRMVNSCNLTHNESNCALLSVCQTADCHFWFIKKKKKKLLYKESTLKQQSSTEDHIWLCFHILQNLLAYGHNQSFKKHAIIVQNME